MAIIKDFVVKSGIVVQGTATSISTSSGALTVAGGVGIAENINLGGQGRFGITAFRGTGSTSTTTSQTLRVDGGGLGISGDSAIWGRLAVADQAFFRNENNAVSTNSGAVTILGGLGVGRDIYAQSMYSNGAIVLTTATVANFGVTTLTAGTDTAVNTSTGAVTVWNISTLQSVTTRGATTNNAISITNTTNSSNTTTGALRVTGGVGVGGNIYAGGLLSVGLTLAVGSNATFSGTDDATSLTTASVVLAGGLAVRKRIYAENITVTTASQSVASVAGNALAITSGGLGVAGSGLFGGNVVVQGTASSANTNSGQALLVTGGVGVGGNLAASSINIVNSTLATDIGAGALIVNGGAYIGQNLIVHSTASSTTTNSANALYVRGGAWFDNQVFVKGTVTFDGNVVFNGTQTNVYSTNTVYTDNILNLHVPAGSTGTEHNWSFDDGKDIGLAFHYFKTVDKNAFLGWANDTGYLEWYEDGYESTTGNHETGTYGTFKLANIVLVGDTANGGNTNTGALTVAGGVGIQKDMYIGGVGATANSSTVNAQTLVVAANGLGVTGDSYFANNLGVGGGLGLVVTNHISAGGTISIAGGTGSSTQLNNQGLRVSTGGIGVSGNSYIDGQVGITGATAITNATASSSTSSGALTVVGGAGIGQNLYVGGTIFGNLTGIATTASNLQGGAQGSIPIQSSAGNTGFIPLGTVGQILTVGVNTATWANFGDLSAGTATNALNVAVTTTNVNANYYLTFVSTVSGFNPVLVDTNIVYNPNTNALNLTGTADSTTSTNGTLVVNGGIGVAKNIVVGSTLTNFGVVNVLNQTASSSQTTGALTVAGGAGINGNLYAGAIYDGGQRVVTRVRPVAGDFIGIDSITENGTATTFTVHNLGVRTLTAGTDTAVSTSTGTVTVWNVSTLQSVTTRGATTNNAISITNATETSSTSTGALVVGGGIGVNRSLFVGGTITRSGPISSTGWLTAGIGIKAPAFTATDTTLTGAQGTVAIHSLGIPTIVATGGTPTYSNAATLYIDGAPIAGSGATITNPYSLLINAGNVRINAGTSSTTTATGALQVVGGLGVGGAIVAGGSVTAGTTVVGSVVNGLITNNALIATYTSGSITNTTTQNLDSWSTSSYRTAKYMIQLVDTGFSPTRVHATELMVFHDNITVYKSEYGVVTNVSELGSFDAIISSNNVVLQFTPAPTPSNLTIKVFRTAITS